MAGYQIGKLIASIRSEEFPHYGSKRDRRPIVVPFAIRVLKLLLKLFSEGPKKLLHEGVSPERALSIKVLHDSKRGGHWADKGCGNFRKV